MMRKNKLTALLIAVLSVAATLSLRAQYDDLYYDPDKDGSTYSSSTYSSSDRYATDDDEYSSDYDDEYYDYYYTSRIKRFYRPYYGFGYYDPVYVDSYYYGQAFSPSVTVLIYDSPFGYNNYYNYRRASRWNSWNRWNNFGYAGAFYDPWYGSGFRSGFGNYYTVNNYYGSGFGGYGGYGGFGGSYGYGGGYASNYYCPPSWGNGYGYSTVNSVRNNTSGTSTSYGPRTYGTTRVSRTDNGREDVRNTNGSTTTRRRSVADTQDGVNSNTRAPENAGSLERHTIRPDRNETTPQMDRSRSSAGRSIDNSATRQSRAAETPRSLPNSRSYERETPSRSRSIDRTPTTRQSAPQRTYEPPRQSRTIDRSPSTPRSSGSFDRGSSSMPRSSSGSSISTPRSSGSSGSSAPSRSRGGRGNE